MSYRIKRTVHVTDDYKAETDNQWFSHGRSHTPMHIPREVSSVSSHNPWYNNSTDSIPHRPISPIEENPKIRSDGAQLDTDKSKRNVFQPPRVLVPMEDLEGVRSDEDDDEFEEDVVQDFFPSYSPYPVPPQSMGQDENSPQLLKHDTPGANSVSADAQFLSDDKLLLSGSPNRRWVRETGAKQGWDLKHESRDLASPAPLSPDMLHPNDASLPRLVDLKEVPTQRGTLPNESELGRHPSTGIETGVQVNSIDDKESVKKKKKRKQRTQRQSFRVALRSAGRAVMRVPPEHRASKCHTVPIACVRASNGEDEVIFTVRDGSSLKKNKGSRCSSPCRDVAPVRENLTLFQCANCYLAADPVDPYGPVLLRRLYSRKDKANERCSPFRQRDKDGSPVLCQVWDVQYEGEGVVGLRSIAHPKYWLSRDPTANTLGLVSEGDRTKRSKFRILCLTVE